MSIPATDERDQQDMARLIAGQDAALNDLMARHAQPLLRYLVRLLLNETEAEDLAEESFVRVYQHRARFRLGQKFSTWLYAIATNLARDRQRWRGRHPQVSLDAEVSAPGASLSETLSEARPDAAQALEASERAELVRNAVAALPEELRAPLVLAEYEDRTHAEIAAILDCSPKAVEMRVYRARQALRRQLAGLLQTV